MLAILWQAASVLLTTRCTLDWWLGGVEGPRETSSKPPENLGHGHNFGVIIPHTYFTIPLGALEGNLEMKDFIATRLSGTSAIVERGFQRAVKQTGVALDSDTAKDLKKRTLAAVDTIQQISKNLVDVNGDGKFDAEDIKLAAEKAGIVWDKIDPDLKTALVAGGVAGVGVNFIPLVGQLIAFPAFVATSAYFFLVAKLTKLRK